MHRTIKIKGIAESTAVLKLEINNNMILSIIQIYMLTSDTTENKIDLLYSVLDKTFDEENINTVLHLSYDGVTEAHALRWAN